MGKKRSMDISVDTSEFEERGKERAGEEMGQEDETCVDDLEVLAFAYSIGQKYDKRSRMSGSSAKTHATQRTMDIDLSWQENDRRDLFS